MLGFSIIQLAITISDTNNSNIMLIRLNHLILINIVS